MTRIHFSDGITIDTDGSLRKIELHDGWYVVGEGVLVPVMDEHEADQTLREMKGEVNVQQDEQGKHQ